MKLSREEAKVAKQAALVVAWSAAHPADTRVFVNLNGEIIKARTMSTAWLENGVAVVRVAGISGPFRLDRVAVRED